MACESRSHWWRRRDPRGARTRARTFGLLLAALWFGGSVAGLHAQTEEGQKVFQAKCATCHTIGRGSSIGPDLAGVVDQRDRDWLTRWITNPEGMVAASDPLALQLLADFDQLPMPNSNLAMAEVEAVIAYMKSASDAAGPGAAGPRLPPSARIADLRLGSVQALALGVFAVIIAIVIGVFLFVARTTGRPQAVDMKAAYRLRRLFFITGSAAVLILLAMTLPNNPYDLQAETADEIVYTTARQFSFLYSREPVASVEDLETVATLPVLEVPAGTLVEFRVTTLDATHGFGVYDLNGAVIGQTQAMPGYVNRLRIRFDEPGTYPVLCMEYCGVAHHIMRSAIVVK